MNAEAKEVTRAVRIPLAPRATPVERQTLHHPSHCQKAAAQSEGLARSLPPTRLPERVRSLSLSLLRRADQVLVRNFLFLMTPAPVMDHLGSAGTSQILRSHARLAKAASTILPTRDAFSVG